MKIACIGGGPAGLYTALLAKKNLPGAEVTVFERNRIDDTFGWGVVFSDETLGRLRRGRSEELSSGFAINSLIGPTSKPTSVGRACARRVTVFPVWVVRTCCAYWRIGAWSWAVALRLETEVDPAELPEADLVVGADGVKQPHSRALRGGLPTQFDWRRCKFMWLGTDLP